MFATLNVSRSLGETRPFERLRSVRFQWQVATLKIQALVWVVAEVGGNGEGVDPFTDNTPLHSEMLKRDKPPNDWSDIGRELWESEVEMETTLNH